MELLFRARHAWHATDFSQPGSWAATIRYRVGWDPPAGELLQLQKIDSYQPERRRSRYWTRCFVDRHLVQLERSLHRISWRFEFCLQAPRVMTPGSTPPRAGWLLGAKRWADAYLASETTGRV